ncbi:unnamed protein product [Zymoseptoria tritici ST99CH_1A5]|uniref:Uncharacterized protein n=3 Tax=Zymoseptoria tritici TaxID=1047171 RepID=A0A1X7RSV1_ZYMT9|nr:unnamed protein product [Zymoseptoria tritici ST99CH_3D7]SMR52238.1 unnamed protein product [Zymoseptoria tritici ST99CH_1E4]SMR53359.1 unnamed protein product [Zymoseptoria tritici ST99CH_3D1]SMY24188.1 unnamed protein product [Zymoseptoria tritici ST99CH_1A5]
MRPNPRRLQPHTSPKNTATTSSTATAPSTSSLSPLRSTDPAEPYNWPTWKKNANLTVVGVHAMMTTFTAAAIISVSSSIALDFSTSMHHASSLTSLQILVLGWAPLF